uniref:Uncharacterized protein n=1 Tax=Pipistrellus kuhlii TaxID=59472 RepID=A0A7J7R2G1_PIPKU|nr:hypothetical protein mPipKuh1_007992 [Pipistrellus kuhlii]
MRDHTPGQGTGPGAGSIPMCVKHVGGSLSVTLSQCFSLSLSLSLSPFLSDITENILIKHKARFSSLTVLCERTTAVQPAEASLSIHVPCGLAPPGVGVTASVPHALHVWYPCMHVRYPLRLQPQKRGDCLGAPSVLRECPPPRPLPTRSLCAWRLVGSGQGCI